ncbi:MULTISPECIES: hypothetical protein [unclassified Granulicatella]|uniref:hypothetical protein n=1 Tax=unclassified Granulicatella TaxID=2630493 RepID=UPI002554F98F|nr:MULTISPECIES: hypothetical protein [unclassified Granulicatella]MDK8380429.1 hypothetical protein [Granulicatella sp. UMB5615B]MDK8523391.1 hypothetical protein [Granulicatella sp. UMB5615A]
MELLRIFGNQFFKDFFINFGVGTLLCLAFFLAVVYTVVKVLMVQESNHTTNSNQSLNEDESKKDNKK